MRIEIAPKYSVGQLSNHVSCDEYRCKCESDDCWYFLYSPYLLDCFELLRYDIGGLPITITSGFRCVYYNDSNVISGESKSRHKIGNAMDIKVPNGVGHDEFVKRCNVHFDYVKYYKHGKYVHVHNNLPTYSA